MDESRNILALGVNRQLKSSNRVGSSGLRYTLDFLKQETFSAKAHRPVNTDAVDRSTGRADQHPSTAPPDALEGRGITNLTDRSGLVQVYRRLTVMTF